VAAGIQGAGIQAGTEQDVCPSPTCVAGLAHAVLAGAAAPADGAACVQLSQGEVCALLVPHQAAVCVGGGEGDCTEGVHKVNWVRVCWRGGGAMGVGLRVLLSWQS
jgi:hypothetical protein